VKLVAGLLYHLKLGPFGIRVFCRYIPWLDEEVGMTARRQVTAFDPPLGEKIH
jgi:hypothetical protein